MITVISSFYNESRNCKLFLEMIEDTSKLIPIDQLVVVDNGSSDNTYKELINLKSQRFKIVVIKNPMLSRYGDGFHVAFKKSKNEFIFTIHSDLQFNLYDFVKNNTKLINSSIENKINIFPKRINRPIFSEIRSLVYRYLLSIIFFTYFNEFSGQPKLLIKKDFLEMKSYCRNFSYDLCLFYYLKKNKKKLNFSSKSKELKRVNGFTSWNKNFFSQFKELYLNISDLIKFKKDNSIK